VVYIELLYGIGWEYTCEEWGDIAGDIHLFPVYDFNLQGEIKNWTDSNFSSGTPQFLLFDKEGRATYGGAYGYLTEISGIIDDIRLNTNETDTNCDFQECGGAPVKAYCKDGFTSTCIADTIQQNNTCGNECVEYAWQDSVYNCSSSPPANPNRTYRVSCTQEVSDEWCFCPVSNCSDCSCYGDDEGACVNGFCESWGNHCGPDVDEDWHFGGADYWPEPCPRQIPCGSTPIIWEAETCEAVGLPPDCTPDQLCAKTFSSDEADGFCDSCDILQVCEGEQPDDYILVVSGCTDSTANNYDPTANYPCDCSDTPDACCTYDVYGCMDIDACNYDEEANIEDGTCEYPLECEDCDGNCLNTTECNFGERGCDGVCGSGAVLDECGTCEGTVVICSDGLYAYDGDCSSGGTYCDCNNTEQITCGCPDGDCTDGLCDDGITVCGYYACEYNCYQTCDEPISFWNLQMIWVRNPIVDGSQIIENWYEGQYSWFDFETTGGMLRTQDGDTQNHLQAQYENNNEWGGSYDLPVYTESNSADSTGLFILGFDLPNNYTPVELQCSFIGKFQDVKALNPGCINDGYCKAPIGTFADFGLTNDIGGSDDDILCEESASEQCDINSPAFGTKKALCYSTQALNASFEDVCGRDGNEPCKICPEFVYISDPIMMDNSYVDIVFYENVDCYWEASDTPTQNLGEKYHELGASIDTLGQPTEWANNCIYILDGCTDADACNYNEDADVDDGSCEYPEDNFDCDGNCIVDIDCLGQCGGDAVVDCNEDCNGSAVLDDCGICSGGNTGLEINYLQDCNSVCNGEAVIDVCGICCDGDTGTECITEPTTCPCEDGQVADCNGNCVPLALLNLVGQICFDGYHDSYQEPNSSFNPNFYCEEHNWNCLTGDIRECGCYHGTVSEHTTSGETPNANQEALDEGIPKDDYDAISNPPTNDAGNAFNGNSQEYQIHFFVNPTIKDVCPAKGPHLKYDGTQMAGKFHTYIDTDGYARNYPPGRQCHGGITDSSAATIHGIEACHSDDPNTGTYQSDCTNLNGCEYATLYKHTDSWYMRRWECLGESIHNDLYLSDRSCLLSENGSWEFSLPSTGHYTSCNETSLCNYTSCNDTIDYLTNPTSYCFTSLVNHCYQLNTNWLVENHLDLISDVSMGGETFSGYDNVLGDDDITCPDNSNSNPNLSYPTMEASECKLYAPSLPYWPFIDNSFSTSKLRHPINNSSCGGTTHGAGTDDDWIYAYRSVAADQKIYWDEDTLDEFCVINGYERHVRYLTSVTLTGGQGNYSDSISAGPCAGTYDVGPKQFRKDEGVYFRSRNVGGGPGGGQLENITDDIAGALNSTKGQYIGRWHNMSGPFDDYNLVVACEGKSLGPQKDFTPTSVSSIHTEGLGICNCPELNTCEGTTEEWMSGTCYDGEGNQIQNNSGGPPPNNCNTEGDCNSTLDCDTSVNCTNFELKNTLISNPGDNYLDWQIDSMVETSQVRYEISTQQDYCHNGYCPGGYFDEDLLRQQFEICYGNPNDIGQAFTLGEIQGKIMFIEFSSAN